MNDPGERLPTMLARFRERAGLSRKATCEGLGIGGSTIESWETLATYQRLPEPPRLEALLDLYGVSVTERLYARALHYEEARRKAAAPRADDDANEAP